MFLNIDRLAKEHDMPIEKEVINKRVEESYINNTLMNASLLQLYTQNPHFEGEDLDATFLVPNKQDR